MLSHTHPPVSSAPIRRVRAVLLTPRGTLMFIKRIKPHNPIPYWVAPGGGVERDDSSLIDALERELSEEMGATVEILRHGFTIEHTKAGKRLEEHFFICRLVDYDLSLRNGPEFEDPTRGEYLLDEIPLTREGVASIDLRTTQLRDWLMSNLDTLQRLA